MTLYDSPVKPPAPSGAIKKQINKVLEANKHRGFVQRILQPDKFPVLDNGDGSTSTHSMAWAGVDNKYVVFPTVLYNGDAGLKRYPPKQALDLVMQTGNFIEFDTPEEADFFSTSYKEVWKK